MKWGYPPPPPPPLNPPHYILVKIPHILKSRRRLALYLNVMLIFNFNLDNQTGFIEWDLVMKGVSVPDLHHGNLYNLWASNYSVNADIPEARLMDTTFPEPFKSSLVRNWEKMSIQQVSRDHYMHN